MDWSEKILSYFSLKGSMYYVIDQLGVLKNSDIKTVCLENKIILYKFDDPIDFRLNYENKFRHIDRKERKTLVIHGFQNQTNTLPYDVVVDGIQIDFSVHRLFPYFDAAVLMHIPNALFGELFELHKPLFRKMNRTETLDYLLENIYGISLFSIVDDLNLFKLAVAYYNQFEVDLPRLFVKRLEEVIHAKIPFIQSDLIELFQSRNQFERFVNRQWLYFVNRFLGNSDQQIADGVVNYQGQYFTDLSIQKTLIKLVNPVEVEDMSIYDEWMQEGLLPRKNESIFSDDYLLYSREDWLTLANRIGKEQAVLLEKGIVPIQFTEQVFKANSAFQIWIQANFSNLRTLPSVPTPKMVHQIPHFLRRRSDQKIALVVLDGMSFTQWYTIKKFLSGSGLSFEDQALFSWVPSVTSVSRQSIFSGKEPRNFAATIDTTRKEKQYWEEFWQSQGFSKSNIAYEKSLGLRIYDAKYLSYRQNPNIRIYGAVIDVIDQIMHGATQGIKTIQSELNNWLSSNYLLNFLTDLISDDFEIYITSDHGNVECMGRGRIPQGVTVETKGERFRTYQSEIIRNQTAIDNPDTIIWNDTSLPEDYFVLLANDKRAFTNKNDKIVTHGGIHIEEMIVPFVKVTC